MPFETASKPREQILHAAAELFFERGFASTGMNAIGERIGVSGPALYTHFKSKHEILATLALDGIDRMMARVGDALDDPDEDLDHIVRNHVEEILEDRTLASVYVTEGKALPASLRDPIVARLGEYNARWTAAVERCWPEQDRERLLSATNAAMGIAHSVVLWNDAALETDDLVDLLVAMTFAALAVLDDPA